VELTGVGSGEVHDLQRQPRGEASQSQDDDPGDDLGEPVSLNLDRSTWKRIAFGDAIESVAERVDNPFKAKVDCYVSLEHLDPGVMTVQRWGAPEDVSAQKLPFEPGDVIFGRRRAYQKKVARADFRGICSAHALVLRARPDMVDPDFLPVFLSSDYFLDRAISISVGSLSPTINSRDLRVQEFELPPLGDQKRIADLLWAMTGEIESQIRLQHSHASLLRRYCELAFRSWAAEFPKVPLTSIGELRMGRQKAPKYMTGEHSRPYLRVANVGELELDLSAVEEMDFDDSDFERFQLQAGDILLTEGDIVSPVNVGRPALYLGEISSCCFQNTLIRFRPNDNANSRFAVVLFEGMRLAGVFASAASTTTVTHLGLRRLSAIEVPQAPTEVQNNTALAFDALFDGRKALRDFAHATRSLRTSLLEVISR